MSGPLSYNTVAVPTVPETEGARAGAIAERRGLPHCEVPPRKGADSNGTTYYEFTEQGLPQTMGSRAARYQERQALPGTVLRRSRHLRNSFAVGEMFTCRSFASSSTLPLSAKALAATRPSLRMITRAVLHGGDEESAIVYVPDVLMLSSNPRRWGQIVREGLHTTLTDLRLRKNHKMYHHLGPGGILYCPTGLFAPE